MSPPGVGVTRLGLSTGSSGSGSGASSTVPFRSTLKVGFDPSCSMLSCASFCPAIVDVILVTIFADYPGFYVIVLPKSLENEFVLSSVISTLNILIAG